MKKKLYELRIYSVIPSKYNELLSIWENEGKILISKYMKCIGVWNSESGELNEIYHLYEWESSSHRDHCRQGFYDDIEAKKYVKKVKPFYVSQRNYMLHSLEKLFK